MIKNILLVAITMLASSSYATSLVVPAALKGKVISVIVPYGAGGQSDVTARQLAEKVQKKTGLTVNVINRPGASGNIGAMSVANSDPNGLTVCQCETGPAFVNEIMGITGSPARGQLVPISVNIENALAVIVSANAPYDTIPELMTYLKSHSSTAGYAATGSISVLWSEQMLDFGGVKGMQPIIYKSQAEALTSIISGFTAFVIASPGDAVKLIDGKRLKALAVGSDRRLPMWPNVPTLKETYPMTMVNYNGIYAPAGVPKPIQEFLNYAWNEATWDIDNVLIFHNKGILPVGGDLPRAQAFFDRYYKGRKDLYLKYSTLVEKYK